MCVLQFWEMVWYEILFEWKAIESYTPQMEDNEIVRMEIFCLMVFIYIMVSEVA